MRGNTVARSPALAFLSAALAAVASGATTSESALLAAASNDAHCRFGGGADPEDSISLEGTEAGHARAFAARALPDTALGGGVIGGSGNAKTSVVVSASLNGGADWISDASAGGFAYAPRTTLLRVAPRRVLAAAVSVVDGMTTITVDGADGVNKPSLACATSMLAPVTDGAVPDARLPRAQTTAATTVTTRAASSRVRTRRVSRQSRCALRGSRQRASRERSTSRCPRRATTPPPLPPPPRRSSSRPESSSCAFATTRASRRARRRASSQRRHRSRPRAAASGGGCTALASAVSTPSRCSRTAAATCSAVGGPHAPPPPAALDAHRKVAAARAIARQRRGDTARRARARDRCALAVPSSSASSAASPKLSPPLSETASATPLPDSASSSPTVGSTTRAGADAALLKYAPLPRVTLVEPPGRRTRRCDSLRQMRCVLSG